MTGNIQSFFAPMPDAETQWERFSQTVQTREADFFDGPGPIVGARAPGRLDVMGGVADYSGSLVLEMPISQAACVAWQWREDRQIKIRSIGIEGEGMLSDAHLSLSEIMDVNGHPLPVEKVKENLTSDPDSRWAAYIAGCYYVMLSAYSKMSQGKADERFGQLGANILLQSEVPLGGGVSSSAAIEVATMHALSEAAGIHPSDLTLAAWCQKVENTVVGAPCGIMDQVTSALGIADCLTILRCQPHDLLGAQPLPPGWKVMGLDSRVKHSVGGSHYTMARVGAFMGLKIIQLESGGKLLENYLCKMGSKEFATYRDMIPELLTGQKFHDLYGRLPDRVTHVNPDETYHPRSCAEHPILENERVKDFFQLIQRAELRAEAQSAVSPISAPEKQIDLEIIREAGELMYESHSSYSERLNLGSPETDLLVALIRERGPECGLYGAKITGGGAGGTVAVLYSAVHPDSEAALGSACVEYENKVGIAPRPFVGSSDGALAFGARQILRG